MAGYDDPFTPGQDSDPTAGLPPSTFGALTEQWNDFLSDSRGRGALLSMGLSMMQPRQFGQTPLGQLGTSIGTAGESVRTNEKLDLAQEEAASRQDLRGAQASAAEARAGAAGARAGEATSRLQLKEMEIKALNERQRLGQKVQISRLYQQYVKDAAKRNSDAQFNGTPQEPIKDMGTWIKSNPALKDMGLVPSEDDDEETPSTPGASGSSPEAPRDPAKRTVGSTYNTPKGALKWTGKGWVAP